jgi:hypothetical protein
MRDEGAHQAEARLAYKYLGAGKAESWLANTNWEPLLVRLEPGELRVCDFADDDLWTPNQPHIAALMGGLVAGIRPSVGKARLGDRNLVQGWISLQ